MKNWITELASHYEAAKHQYPNDRLLILFDIDGTILDMRHMVWHLLRNYDRNFGSTFFKSLTISEIRVHENQVMPLLAELQIELDEQERILDWYKSHAWSSSAILEAHRPFRGVLDVLRWFQMQPNTFVGLNTARPGRIRVDTLRSLNKLGREYKVRFDDRLLYMKNNEQDEVTQAKVAGVHYFQQLGYRVIAFVDNEPANLEAVSEYDVAQDILLLHADTIFQSKRNTLPSRAVSGQIYNLSDLIPEKRLPQHIQFVWHGIDDMENLTQFLTSEVHWGEFDVRMDPIHGDLILRPDSFEKTPIQKDETWVPLDQALNHLRPRNKGIKLDLKSGGLVIDRILELMTNYDFNDSNLWFNSEIETLHERGFRRLATAFSGAIIQCPVDFLAPLISATPTKAKEILDMFTSWGINRFSIGWHTPQLRQFFDQMDQWGYEVNIYNIPDLEGFLQAVLLMPQSITSDFNFPKWDYFGKGSGENEFYYNFPSRQVMTETQSTSL